MATRRLTIAGLMLIVAVAALEVAAVRDASPSFADGSRVLTVLLLLSAAWLARTRGGGQGAFWFGFAAFGTAYFALTIDSLYRMQMDSSLFTRLPWELIRVLHIPQSRRNDPFQGARRQVEILNGILSLAFGLVGGSAAWLASRRAARSRASETAAPPEPDGGVRGV